MATYGTLPSIGPWLNRVLQQNANWYAELQKVLDFPPNPGFQCSVFRISKFLETRKKRQYMKGTSLPLGGFLKITFFVIEPSS